jgi:hypothetical protein
MLGLGVLLASPAAAQDDAPGPPGPFVVDVRGAFSSLSTDRRLSALLPSAANPPTRGLGLDIGVHVYPVSIGPARVGFGAAIVRAAGERAPVEGRAATSSTSAVAALPGVSTTFTALVPQVSLNFGSDSGWSYLSAGVGRSSVRNEILPAPGMVTTGAGSTGTGTTSTDANGATASSETTTADTIMDSGGLTTINIGGGARWFAKQHLAFTFDVRFHRLPAGSLGDATATTLIVASVGVSLR